MAATEFATLLFQALAKREPIPIALQHARAGMGQTHTGVVYRDQYSPQRAAIAQSQWCLPQLLSHDLNQALVDWQFTPQPVTRNAWQTKRGEVSLPERFIGRRRELRQWKNRLRGKNTHSLLLTGAGGMGKTALAGKLLDALEQDGYQVFTLSLRAEHHWQDVLLDMELALTEHEYLFKKYQLVQSKGLSESKKAEYLFRFLLEKTQGKLALFFDNLESIQQPQAPYALTDASLQAWLQAAKALSAHGLKLIATSRWRLPDWAETEHYALAKPVFGDYVALVRLLNIELKQQRLVDAYQALGGNFRALLFFANAAKGMNLKEEQAFLATLAHAEREAQTDMALAKVVEQCSAAERELLRRLLAYQTAVPLDSVQAVWEVAQEVPPSPILPAQQGQGAEPSAPSQPAHPLPDSGRTGGVESVLPHLLAVSLVEQYEVQGEQTTYQVAALVRSWLLANGTPEPTQALLQAAAEFLHWQLENGLNTTWEHKLATHAALTAANLIEAAHRVVLDWIVAPLNLAGMYRTLLDDWLLNPKLKMAEATNPQIKGDALNQIGKQYFHMGNYDIALNYYQQSLAIQQHIGDKSGEGTTLNNISQIYSARGDYDTALNYLQQSLAIYQEIGHKEGEGTTLNNMALTAHARGDYHTALDFLQQSLAIQQDIGDKQGIGVTLNNISPIYAARGDYDTALDYLQQSLTIQQDIGGKQGIGATLNNMATIAHARGDYHTALDFLQQALTIRQEIGDLSGQANTLNNMATIAHARGDYHTALDFLKKSLAIAQQIGDKSGEGTTLNNISQTFKAFGDYDAALNYLQQALVIAQQIGNRKTEGTTLNNISLIYSARGNYCTALNFLQQSLVIRQEIGDVEGFCATLFNIGHIHLRNEEMTEAVQAWVRVYSTAKKIGYAQALQALEKLAAKFGMSNGLAGWERLAQTYEQTGKISLPD